MLFIALLLKTNSLSEYTTLLHILLVFAALFSFIYDIIRLLVIVIMAKLTKTGGNGSPSLLLLGDDGSDNKGLNWLSKDHSTSNSVTAACDVLNPLGNDTSSIPDGSRTSHRERDESIASTNDNSHIRNLSRSTNYNSDVDAGNGTSCQDSGLIDPRPRFWSKCINDVENNAQPFDIELKKLEFKQENL